MAIKN